MSREDLNSFAAPFGPAAPWKFPNLGIGTLQGMFYPEQLDAVRIPLRVRVLRPEMGRETKALIVSKSIIFCSHSPFIHALTTFYWMHPNIGCSSRNISGGGFVQDSHVDQPDLGRTQSRVCLGQV